MLRISPVSSKDCTALCNEGSVSLKELLHNVLVWPRAVSQTLNKSSFVNVLCDGPGDPLRVMPTLVQSLSKGKAGRCNCNADKGG